MLSKRESLFYLNLFSTLFCQSKSNIYIEPRILTEDIALPSQYPYNAYLTFKGDYKCSGSIIHKHWILTAGHCLGRYNESHYDALKVYVAGGRQEYSLEYFTSKFFYPAKEWACKRIDIALIRISGTIEFNEFAQPIALPDSDFQPLQHVDSWGTIIGWGTSKKNIPVYRSNATLRYADLKIVNADACFFSTELFGVCEDPVTSPSFCAAAAGLSTCSGDSGAPFVIDNVQIGVLSGSYCKKGQPVYLMSVAFFVPWIKAELANYGDSLEDQAVPYTDESSAVKESANPDESSADKESADPDESSAGEFANSNDYSEDS